MTPTTPQFISRKQAAILLSCSEQLVAKLNRQGKLPAYHLGRAVRIKLSDLETLLRREQ